MAMLAWVISRLDCGEALRTLRKAEYEYIFPVVVIMVFDFLLRAIRWGSLFDYPYPTVGNRFVALMIGYLGNNVFPARAGQIARVYVLGHREKVGKGAVLAGVMVEHAIDLAVIVMLSFLVLFSYPKFTRFREAGFILAFTIFAGLFSFTAVSITGRKTIPIIVRLVRFLPENIVFLIRNVLEDFITGLSSLRRASKLFQFLSWTAFIWITELATVLLMARAFHLNLSMLDGLLFILAVGLGTMVPSSPGYVGTYEFFATNALMTVGIGGGAALGFAFSLHALMFLTQSLLGIGCMARCGIDAYRFFAFRALANE